MANCPITPKDFLGTETGTRLKELCGNDVVKFNAITALVYNPESKTGFTKEFDTIVINPEESHSFEAKEQI